MTSAPYCSLEWRFWGQSGVLSMHRIFKLRTELRVRLKGLWIVGASSSGWDWILGKDWIKQALSGDRAGS